MNRLKVEDLKTMAKDNKRDIKNVNLVKAKYHEACKSEYNKQMTKLQKNACDYCLGKTKNASGIFLG